MEQALRSILLVDDEDDHHFITKLTLRQAGYAGEFHGVHSAESALDRLRSSANKPDLMLVDINMPATNGFELLEVCEREGLLPNGRTMVVMCSSSNRPVDIDAANRLKSVSDYIEKAFTTEHFEHLKNSFALNRA